MDFSLHLKERTAFSRIDWSLIIVILCLNLIGLVNLYSATHGPNSRELEPLFINQIVWLITGWGFFFLITLMDYNFVNRLAFIIYFFNLIAIIYVFFFGHVALGAQRWIDFGFFRYQPSETMKLALIVLLAKILVHRNTLGHGMDLRELMVPLLALLIPFAIIVEQPDLGTAMMIGTIGTSILIFVKVKKRVIVGALILGMVGAWGAWQWGLRDYQKNRILTFLSPANDARGKAYHAWQSRISVGSGQFFGKGFRKGTQSQLEFLPERHTDFIYSVLSEEHGFVGSVLTLGLFCALFYFIVRIAINARDKFGALLCVGVLSYVFWHMFINIGMVLGLLPIVGVPLPLLSYGGSSMLTTMTGLGLVSSVAFRRYLF